jgi:hypothetical protein
MTEPQQRKPLLLLPIVWSWRLVTFVASMTGIVLALILGLLFMMVGLAFASTFIGAFVGIPIFILGFLLLIRALY